MYVIRGGAEMSFCFLIFSSVKCDCLYSSLACTHLFECVSAIFAVLLQGKENIEHRAVEKAAYCGNSRHSLYGWICGCWRTEYILVAAAGQSPWCDLRGSDCGCRKACQGCGQKVLCVVMSAAGLALACDMCEE